MNIMEIMQKSIETPSVVYKLAQLLSMLKARRFRYALFCFSEARELITSLAAHLGPDEFSLAAKSLLARLLQDSTSSLPMACTHEAISLHPKPSNGTGSGARRIRSSSSCGFVGFANAASNPIVLSDSNP
jgi:hypothetical protein